MCWQLRDALNGDTFPRDGDSLPSDGLYVGMRPGESYLLAFAEESYLLAFAD
jgi:hypothetical protein